jgi:hypothetical protein
MLRWWKSRYLCKLWKLVAIKVAGFPSDGHREKLEYFALKCPSLAKENKILGTVGKRNRSPKNIETDELPYNLNMRVVSFRLR